MSDTWARPVEQILLSTAQAKARIVGVVSADAKSGVTTLCAQMADASARAGTKTLLANFSDPVIQDERNGWVPTDGVIQLIQPHAGDYDVLAVRPTAGSRARFNNVNTLQHLLNEQLKAYDQIILDLPAVLHTSPDFINPVAAARASDFVILVAPTAKIRQNRLKAALDILDAAGVNLGGMVVNDVDNPPLGQRIAASARKLARWSERLAAWLERKALRSEFLNTPL